MEKSVQNLLKTLILLVSLSVSDSVFALELGTGLMPPALQKYAVKYSGTIQPKSGTHQETLFISAPLHRGERDGFVVFTASELLDFYPDQASTPNLYKIQIGGAYTHLYEGRKLLSLSASYGSASDKPFKDSTVNTIDSTALYSFSNSPTSNWLLILNYSNNRPFLNNIPLPGFAYTYMPSKTFRGTFGAPFASIFWQFEDRWSVTSFVVVPWVMKTSIAYDLAPKKQIFVGADFNQMTYFQYGRANLKDRIFYDEKKAFFGFRSPLGEVLSLEIETGYAFDRSLFTAKKYTPSPAHPVELESAVYGKLGLSAAF